MDISGLLHCSELSDSDFYIDFNRENFLWLPSHPTNSYTKMKHVLSGSVISTSKILMH